MSLVLAYLPLIGPWMRTNPMIAILLVTMLFDVITGVACALRFKKVDSSIGRKGLTHKIGLLTAVLFCKALELTVVNGLPIAEISAAGLAVNEGFSLIENFGQLGIQLPYISQFFAKLRDVQATPPNA